MRRLFLYNLGITYINQTYTNVYKNKFTETVSTHLYRQDCIMALLDCLYEIS